MKNLNKMDNLNNPESEIYKKTLEKQNLYISRKLNTIKNRIIMEIMIFDLIWNFNFKI